MVVLPLAEIVGRAAFGVGIPASGPIVQNLTLWVGFLGAAIAARENELLSLATGDLLPKGRPREVAKLIASTVAAAVSAMLARASAELVLLERDGSMEIGAGIPVWIVQLVLPVSFGLIALRLALRAYPAWWGRVIALAGAGAGLWLGLNEAALVDKPAWPFVVVVIVASLLGGPIFAALGGAALFLFITSGVPAAAIPAETYRLGVSPTLAAIPLFTLTGFLLAEGRASERLLRLFRAFFGWIPGGTAIVTAALCAFFTVFTGGSGVTILALGGLLYPALIADRYRERFSLGLLTASGSLGLLWPPALPIILYAVVADIPYENLFIGGALPGLLMFGLVAAYGVREGLVTGAGRTTWSAREAAAALWQAKWEVLLPIVVLIAIFGGFATIVESAALAALYALVSQTFIHRDLSFRRDLLRVLQRCALVVGGVIVILGVAMGLTSYLIDAQVAARTMEWAQGALHSKFAFLLALNGLLLIVGCLMDIFSAIVVVVPLIIPISQAFGIDPVHLGIIFVANLELGYLTPPVGLNLFLASYRFNKPLMEVTRATMPMLLILLLGVLLITYVPVMTLGPLAMFGR
jgi:tripartite ATP-independent transporter DctM subunit